MNNKIVMMLALCAALTACSKQDTAPAAPAPAPAAESAPAAPAPAPAPAEQAAPAPAPAPAEQAAPAPAPAAASGSIDTSGLPQECVDYVKRFEACTAKMSNAEMRDGMNANLAETVKELQAEEDKAELPGSCKNMAEAMTKTPMMENC